MRLIKHLRNGNGDKSVTFVRHQDRCGYAWGFAKSEYRTIPTEDSVAAERGVTWHPNFYSAMVAWSEHRTNTKTSVGGGHGAKERPPVRRLVRKQRKMRSA